LIANKISALPPIYSKPNKLIVYEISKGSPLKNNRGELHFFSEEESSKLIYTIRFEPKVNFQCGGVCFGV